MPPVHTSLAGVTSTGQYSPFSFSSRIWTQSSTFRVTSLHLQNTSNAVSFVFSFLKPKEKERRKEKERGEKKKRREGKKKERRKEKANPWPRLQIEEVKEHFCRCHLWPPRVISCAELINFTDNPCSQTSEISLFLVVIQKPIPLDSNI